MGFEKGRTGPYTTKIESVYDVCMNGTLLATRLSLCLFQGIGGVQDGILRHRAPTVCTGSTCKLVAVWGWGDEILAEEKRRETDATTVWLRPVLGREDCSEDLSWTVSLTASTMLSR